jgi:hypothetical protein
MSNVLHLTTAPDRERLTMIRQQLDAGALTQAARLSQEPGPVALVVVSAMDTIAVSMGFVSAADRLAARRRLEMTGEEIVLAVASSVTAIAELLARHGFQDAASSITDVEPPERRTWVVCVAGGGATAAAITIDNHQRSGMA